MTSKPASTKLFMQARKKFERECKRNGSSEEATVAAQRLQDKAVQKWADMKDRDTHIPDVWIRGIMLGITKFITFGDVAMQVAPQSVGLAWLGIRLTLSAIQSDFSLYGLFSTGLSDVTDIMVIMAQYEMLYNNNYDGKTETKLQASSSLTKLSDTIVDTYTAVLNFSFSVHKHLNGGTQAKIRHAVEHSFGIPKAKFQEKLDIVSKFKKEVLETSHRVFQEKSLRQSELVLSAISSIENTVSNIGDFQSTMQDLKDRTTATTKAVKEMQKELRETSTNTKAKTPWDMAVDDFKKNNEALKPLNDTSEKLGDAIDLRYPGTCQWIFEQPKYRDWQVSSKGMLCLEGSGKSVVLATVVEHLDLDVEYTSKIFYLSCGLNRDDDSSRVAPTADSICNKLLHWLYAFAKQNEQQIEVLKDCNGFFENFRTKTKEEGKDISSKMGLVGTGESGPDFVDTFSSLMQRLDVGVTIALDGLERMPLKDSENLVTRLKSLRDRMYTKASFRVIVTCGLKNRVHDMMISLNVGEFNREDMAKMLSEELKSIPGLTQSEFKEATDAIRHKAGSRFAYVRDIGIPFMREPFQRPMSDRLNALPEGMKKVYSTALQVMGPNHAELLRTALMWTLLARVDPTIELVMDTYNRKYEERVTKAEAEARSLEHLTLTGAHGLELKQLRNASGPFLRINQDTTVVLTDFDHIKEFVMKTGSSELPHSSNKETLCTSCQSSLTSTRSVEFDQKYGHLHLARICLRHLNNPVFQRKAIGQSKEDRRENGIDETDGMVEHNGDMQEVAVLTENDPTTKTQNGIMADATGLGTEMKNEDKNKLEEADEHKTVGPSPERHSDTDTDTDDFNDDKDRCIEQYPDDYGDSMNFDCSTYESRYEMQYWMYHLREAQEQWNSTERAKSQGWAEIFDELDYLTSTNVSFFNLLENNANPLSVAAKHGLTSWIQHLLVKGETHNSQEEIQSALEVAASRLNNTATLKTLLENIEEPKDVERFNGAFQKCLSVDPSFDTIKLWLDYGADPSKSKRYNGFTGFHYFAWGGTDSRVLALLLDHVTEPNINVQARDGMTPLHLLMCRQEVPKDLLKTFLDHDADINRDDSHSKRPLQLASVWGELATLRILLD
ncbi:Ank-2 domain-containing protein [Pyrenophora tritici-repentis]|nr:Ank-2 domain-containing protein [Pyrenophora tritici-repentis]